MSENNANGTNEIVLSIEMSDAISAQTAEAWAVGKRGGVDVADTDPTYHNNAKYYAEQCADAAQAAQDAEEAAAQADSAKTDAEAARDRAEAIGAGAAQSAGAAAESAQAAATAKAGAESAQTAAAGSANSAAAAATSAASSASTATGAAAAASSSETAAGQSASAAAGSATAADESAQAAAQSAEDAQDVLDSIPADYSQLSDDVSGLKSAIVTKAEEDGYYEELTAGSAEQLVSTEAVTDTTPYLYRKSGGSVDIGNRATLEKIVGGTVCWNQFVKELNATNFIKSNNSSSVSFDNGVATLNAAVNYGGMKTTYNVPITSGHKYLVSVDLKVTTTFNDSGNISINTSNGRLAEFRFKPTNTSAFETFAKIMPASGDDNTALFVWDTRSSGFDNIYVKNLVLFDLTAMFGPTIADYIYNLEQANAGDGVAWFRKLFPKDYYSYNPGELISVKTTSHDMVGFNAWDEEWEAGSLNINTGIEETVSARIRSSYIKVLPDTIYYCKAPNPATYALAYDAEKKYIGICYRLGTTSGEVTNASFKTLERTAYIRLRIGNNSNPISTYNHDICINLSNSGTRNGEYEPYEKHSYPLADVELRGPLAIDADGKLVYSGDEYPPSGQVKRKYKLLDLGTPTWEYYTSGANPCFIARIPDDMKTYAYGSMSVNMVCAIYKCTAANGVVAFTNESQNMTLAFSTTGSYVNRLLIQNTAYTDGTAFKTAMSGVYLLYELATPETEQVASYTPVQVVDDCGTEEFVDTREVAIPVGHVTKYPADLVKKLTGLPWNFSTLIAPTEETTTASRVYTVGSYLIYQNTLYKVISAIASGGTITPGTNVTATTIMAELTALA